ncbi:permease [Staphylococcus agnetis]|uniref:PTS system MurNAc-GlcNAc-specific EIIBC component n=1 Tax=Staphylococcus agnetis TaxID=985762 RepID=A0A2T4MPE9_9STAP|nr:MULTISPECIES: PTS transporter subunit EIIC [Staphylococcus]MCO4326002.1 PTS transporter subunit EIIC [Staphylococcus agnetis]MCO4356841.1 PTS transporter subunit EIIC [Staphylococcus agnetis]MCO4362429.1 PTS transporter subunit EIIC [Staphylococcus agnetis]MDG4943346.1 PTS transporter subunit EIIC [Staphylococcus agnetis]NHM91828.1 PTS transporter subunit EIIC [Staphylococcus sp. 10602379]
MQKEKVLAEQLILHVGGVDNIRSIIHCMTRIRLDIRDSDKVDKVAIKATEGVLGIVEDERLQIVVGPGVVNKVASHMANMTGVKLGEEIPQGNAQSLEAHTKAKYQSKPNLFKRIAKTIANIFIPLIPAFVGAGLIGGIAAILNNLLSAGTIEATWIKQLALVFDIIKNGMLAYLAIFTGFNAAREFNATPGLGGVIGGTTLLTGMSPENPLPNIFTGEGLLAGQGGIIGVILAVWVLSLIERQLHKIVPNAVDIIVTPTLTLLIVGLLTIFILMPIAGWISDGLVGVVNGVINHGGIFSGFIIGTFFLPLVMFGLHHIFTPIHIEMINQSGATYLLPIAAMAGAGQVGACLALWCKSKRNPLLRDVLKGALPVGFLGIGEPLIYGVTLPLVRPFFTACIAGGIGGAVISGIGHIGASAIGPSGLSLLPLITHNMFLGYLAGLLAAYVSGFILTFLFGSPKPLIDQFGK